MPQLLVTKKLNKRSKIPEKLPDENNIVDTVLKGHVFFGTEVTNERLPAPPLNKWYVDASGFFYWAGAVSEIIQPTEVAPPSPAGDGSLSLLQIKNGSGAVAGNAQKFMPFIMDTCKRFSIDSPKRQLCFLSQLGHESMGLFFTEELASGAAYEGNVKDLGNTEPGDGIRFKGRGLIQITGRANYGRLSKAFGTDFIANPALLGGKNINKCSEEQLRNAALSAGWFWDSRSLNSFADKIDLESVIDKGNNLAVFKTITKKINGGLNGFPDRVARFKSGLNFFK